MVVIMEWQIKSAEIFRVVFYYIIMKNENFIQSHCDIYIFKKTEFGDL